MLRNMDEFRKQKKKALKKGSYTKKEPTDYQLAHATGSQADSLATPSQYEGHEETLRSEGTGETESQVSCSSCESCEGNAAAGAWIAVGSSWPSRLASATSVQASASRAEHRCAGDVLSRRSSNSMAGDEREHRVLYIPKTAIVSEP